MNTKKILVLFLKNRKILDQALTRKILDFKNFAIGFHNNFFTHLKLDVHLIFNWLMKIS